MVDKNVRLSNDIAYGHDFIIDRLFNGTNNFFTNYGTMLPATVLTVGGAAAYYSPMMSGILLGMTNE